MFCARCGQQVPDATETCPMCGQPANIQLQAPPPVAAPMASAEAGSLQSPDAGVPKFAVLRPDLQGVGGWLLWFCIGLTILTPLVVLIQVVAASGVSAPEMIIELARVAYGVVTGIALWSVHRSALLLVKIYFGVTFLLVLLGFAGFFIGKGEVSQQQVTALVRTLIWLGIWFAYFGKSARVQATYGQNIF